ncbi:Potassium voltage-gated channel subfamily D member 3 [Mactra antiquata]
MKHFMALKILMYTITASTRELFLLLVVLIIGVVIFACLEYYMEIFSDPADLELEHIPLAFWWALITMTTVGYGDVVPKSGLGYLIGGFCAISGVLVIALSVPVIVKNFTIYYTHAQSREKLKLRKKKFEQTEKWQRLKAGLRSKLKTGALQNALNGMRKKTIANSNESKTVPKVSLLKLGGSNKPSANENTEVSSAPNTTRDIALEDLSDTERDVNIESSEDNTVIATATMANGTVARLNGGTHIAEHSNIPPKAHVRSKFFGGSIKKPNFLRNGRRGAVGDSSKDIELSTKGKKQNTSTA